MKILFRLLFIIGLLVALVFISYQYLLHTDAPLGHQLQQVFQQLTNDGANKNLKENAQRIKESQLKSENDSREARQSESQAERKAMRLYRWKDDNGRTQVTDIPPDDREYKTITYQDPKNMSSVRARPSPTPNI